MKKEEIETLDQISFDMIDSIYNCQQKNIDCSICLCDKIAPDFPLCMLIVSLLKHIAQGDITVDKIE